MLRENRYYVRNMKKYEMLRYYNAGPLSLQERSYLLGNESTQNLLADAGFRCAKTLFGYGEREVGGI